jgi:hypothetical protein
MRDRPCCALPPAWPARVAQRHCDGGQVIQEKQDTGQPCSPVWADSQRHWASLAVAVSHLSVGRDSAPVSTSPGCLHLLAQCVRDLRSWHRAVA